LLGLLTGFAEPHCRNLRTALTAHLEGDMGHFTHRVRRRVERVEVLCATELRLSGRRSAAPTLTGRQLLLAALFGTAALTPITSAGQHGQLWQENVITVAFMTVAVAIVTCAVLVLWGARRT
jgi:hydroxylaminobenzene mutase